MTAALRNGAGAPGLVTSTCDDARGQAGVIEGYDEEVSRDLSADLICKAITSAASAGVQVHPLGCGRAWLLRSAQGADIGTVHGVGALTAAVAGFEAVRADVQALVQQRVRGAA